MKVAGADVAVPFCLAVMRYCIMVAVVGLALSLIGLGRHSLDCHGLDCGCPSLSQSPWRRLATFDCHALPLHVCRNCAHRASTMVDLPHCVRHCFSHMKVCGTFVAVALSVLWSWTIVVVGGVVMSLVGPDRHSLVCHGVDCGCSSRSLGDGRRRLIATLYRMPVRHAPAVRL